MGFLNLEKRMQQVLSPVLGHFTKLEVVKGRGAYLWSSTGQKILDFASGIAVTGTGHCHPKVVKAATRQLKTLMHNCNGVTLSEPTIALAEHLTAFLPHGLDHFFFTQSGTETIEAAIKCAKYVTGKKKIWAFQNGFHGRTYGSMSLTSSKEKYRKPYAPLVPGFDIKSRDLSKLKKESWKDVAAVITELVLGEGGYQVMDKDWVLELSQICKQKKVLLIFDEIQTGFGRTGKMFAFQHFGVQPDMLCLSKAMASGLPLGALVIKKELSEKWDTSTHGGTFTGNPVAARAASATLELISRELKTLPERIKFFEEELKKLSQKFPGLIQESRGLGMMQALEMKSPEISASFRRACLEQGLLLIACGKEYETVRLIPPLIVSKKQIQAAMVIMERVLKKL